jgi:hypothetical protein
VSLCDSTQFSVIARASGQSSNHGIHREYRMPRLRGV